MAADKKSLRLAWIYLKLLSRRPPRLLRKCKPTKLCGRALAKLSRKNGLELFFLLPTVSLIYSQLKKFWLKRVKTHFYSAFERDLHQRLNAANFRDDPKFPRFFLFFPTGATGKSIFHLKWLQNKFNFPANIVSRLGDIFFFETEGGKDAGLEKRLISKMAEYELANLLPAVVVVSVLLLFLLLSLLLAVAFTIVVIVAAVDSASLLSLFLLQFLTLLFWLYL